MPGFRDEKEMWQYEKSRLRGVKWARYELIFPDGHPDVLGSYQNRLHYIENKVGREASWDALRPSQKEHIQWLLDCEQHVWLAFGDPDRKIIRFVHAATPSEYDVPPFWKP